MRAAVLQEAGKPVVIRDDVEIEAPRAGQVAVDVKHCGLCHSDLSLIDGVFPGLLPVVLGHEAAGIVAKVGPGVTSVAPGDPVVLTPTPSCGKCYWCVRGEASNCVNSISISTGMFPDGTTPLSLDGEPVYRGVGVGAFAEQVITLETGAVKIAADVPLHIACVIGCAVQTGVGAVLNAAKVQAGDTVLILGLGGVGLSAVQGARVAGASRILASDPVASRREAALAMGATDLLDPAKDDVVALAQAVAGVGVDFAFETAGRSALLDVGLSAIRNGGTLVCVGAPPLDETFTIIPAALVITGKKVISTVLGDANSLRDIPRYLELWKAGRLDLEALITNRRPLDEINEACDDLRAGKGVRTVLDF
ncbi:MAG: Zn-dependent alcohol dehydrogenase [bacterium]